MSRLQKIIVAVLCALAAGVPFAVASAGTSAAVKGTTPAAATSNSLTGAVTTLRKQITALPKRTPAQKRVRGKAATAATAIGKSVRSGKLCQANSALLKLRKTVGRGSGVKAKASAGIGAASLHLQGLLLAKPASAACGGAKTAPSASGQPEATILKSSPTELEVRVALPAVQLVGKEGKGRAYEQLLMDGLSTDAPAGAPGVPTLGQSFAIPTGATVELDAANSDSYTLPGVDLYPSQPSAVDGAKSGPFADKPFQVNTTAYNSGEPFPAKPATAAPIGELRDINVGQLAIAGAQYTAKTKSLKVFTSVDVHVKFPGSTGKFGGEGSASPWNQSFQSVYSSLFVNGATVAANLNTAGIFPLICGEEMLIVTSPALRTAADKLATARSAKGVFTRVIETGSGAGQAGTTADQIRTYVQAEVANTKCIRPSYLILFGNTTNVPTFTGDTTNPSIPSDFDYALKFRNLYLPDLATGRIPASTLAQANTIIDKIIGYENNPPVNDAYYNNATITSYFQDDDNNGTDDRGFVRTTEALRTVLQNHGKTVSRVYTTDAGRTPLKFDNGNDLPASLKKPTFAWNGTAANVISQVNTGRFLVLHRDHGAPTFVAHPDMDSSTVNALTNGALLPVFFSVNCASGTYDNPSQPSFDEQWLQRAGGGAVGVVGDSRNSPTEVNNRMALGMFDAIYPDTLPSAGSSTAVHTMGDVVNLGKLHVILDTASIIDFYKTQWNSDSTHAYDDIHAEQRLYGYFGDPSMAIRTQAPLFTLATQAFASASLVHVVFPKNAAGGVATLMNDGLPVGKAFVAGDGSVDIDPGSVPAGGKLTVVLNQDGVDSTPVAVDGALTSTTPAPTPTPTPTPTPAPLPNLTVQSVQLLQDPAVQVAVVYRWVVTLKNTGAGPAAAPFDVALHQTGGRVPTDTTETVSTPLAAGDTTTLYFARSAGSGAATATVDSGNVVAETNENDNTLSGQ